MRELGTWKSSLMWGHLESCCLQEPKQLTDLCTSCRSKTALLKQISCLGSEKKITYLLHHGERRGVKFD